MLKRVAFLTLALLLFFSAVPRAFTNSEAVTPKYATYENMKAAFIYNFLLFIDWPDDYFKTKNSPIRVGLFGDKETLNAMKEATKNRKAKNRNIVVTKFSQEESLDGLHIIYISRKYKSVFRKIISKTDTKPVLLIGDFEGFVNNGGIISFFKENDKVRFEINIDTAKKRGFRISSRLLQLARVVREDNLQ